jgi:uncharacterized protein YbjQ (UPF0145 family)
MAVCKKCGKKVGILEGLDVSRRCMDCVKRDASSFTSAGAARMTKYAEDERARKANETAAIDAVLLTTETAVNLNITRRIEIVTAECAFGMNVFKDLFAGIRDIVGGRSEAVQKTMRDARKTALFELKREAYLVGANAVVGVDLDYTEISANSNMIMLVASGTAVIIDPIPETK